MKTMKNIFKSAHLAIKSRREHNGKLTEQQKIRLSVCKDCPLNSDNKEQLTLLDTFKIRLNKILNFFMSVSVDDDSVCTSCGCNLVFKSSQQDPENMCPLGKWDNLKQ
jgi:protein-arginine kinase activator protein McsA